MTPPALIEPIVRGGVEAGTTIAATSDKGATTNAEAASNFSEDARTMVSAERSCRARLTAASSASPVEGEEIETLEINLDEAMRMIDAGAIQDGKTIMLLQYAHRIGLKHLAERRS